MPTVLIADDHEVTRAGARQTLSSLENIDVIAEAENGIQAIALVKKHKPDIILLDVSMPHAGAVEVSLETKKWSPDTKIIIFTGIDQATLLQELLNTGVSGLVMKSDATSVLKTALNAVSEGKVFISPKIANLLETAERKDALSDREKQILMLIVTGKANKEIADILSLSTKTVDNHRSNIMKKLGVHSISQLMAFAYKHGLLQS